MACLTLTNYTLIPWTLGLEQNLSTFNPQSSLWWYPTWKKVLNVNFQHKESSIFLEYILIWGRDRNSLGNKEKENTTYYLECERKTEGEGPLDTLFASQGPIQRQLIQNWVPEPSQGGKGADAAPWWMSLSLPKSEVKSRSEVGQVPFLPSGVFLFVSFSGHATQLVRS